MRYRKTVGKRKDIEIYFYGNDFLNGFREWDLESLCREKKTTDFMDYYQFHVSSQKFGCRSWSFFLCECAWHFISL